jgi:hypothetical protein
VAKKVQFNHDCVRLRGTYEGERRGEMRVRVTQIKLCGRGEKWRRISPGIIMSPHFETVMWK